MTKLTLETHLDDFMSDPTPQQQMAQHINGFWVTQAIYVAARLEIADHLAGGPLSISELAVRTEAHSASLFRLLRALASMGIFRMDDEGLIHLTPLADVLRSDSPTSVRPMALMRGDFQYKAWGELTRCIQTGQSSFEHLFNQPMFDWLAANPESGALFDAAMQSIHGRESSLLVDAFDFSNLGLVIDVGGGNGSFLASILRRSPNTKGVLFDLPAVVERARSANHLAEFAERTRFVSGSFFEQVPTGGDAYTMRHIIHDWDDEQSIRILKNCRRAMSQDALLLIAEFVIPDGNRPFAGKWFDLAMLVGPGGQERTRAEYEQLLNRAGFRLETIHSTCGEISLIEARPIDIAV